MSRSSSCNPSIQQSLCTLETCCIETQGWLDYLPNLAGNSLFLAIFGVLLLVHVGLGIRWRTWGFAVGMVCGAVLEIIGYAGRLALHQNIFDKNNFIIYLVCLTIGPAFVTAAIYLCLARLVQVYGVHFSRIRPAMYSIVFVTCDIISLILQAAGGAIASVGETDATVQTGTDIMVAGLSFQVASLALFMVTCVDLAWRVKKGAQGTRNENFTELTSTRKFKLFLWALGLATITVFVRCIFRVAELQGGFGSDIANDEVAFMVLEGPMMIIAVAVLAVYHPGFCFGGRWEEANFSFGEKMTKENSVELAMAKEPLDESQNVSRIGVV